MSNEIETLESGLKVVIPIMNKFWIRFKCAYCIKDNDLLSHLNIHKLEVHIDEDNKDWIFIACECEYCGKINIVKLSEKV